MNAPKPLSTQTRFATAFEQIQVTKIEESKSYDVINFICMDEVSKHLIASAYWNSSLSARAGAFRILWSRN